MMNLLCTHNIMTIKMNLIMIIHNWHMICRRAKVRCTAVMKRIGIIKMKLIHKRIEMLKILATVTKKNIASMMRSDKEAEVRKTDTIDQSMNMVKSWMMIRTQNNLETDTWMTLWIRVRLIMHPIRALRLSVSSKESDMKTITRSQSSLLVHNSQRARRTTHPRMITWGPRSQLLFLHISLQRALGEQVMKASMEWAAEILPSWVVMPWVYHLLVPSVASLTKMKCQMKSACLLWIMATLKSTKTAFYSRGQSSTRAWSMMMNWILLRTKKMMTNKNQKKKIIKTFSRHPKCLIPNMTKMKIFWRSKSYSRFTESSATEKTPMASTTSNVKYATMMLKIG